MAQNPVGAGPYMLESFKPGQELVLKAFDKYWGGKKGADRLVFRSIPEAATRISALRTGAVDVIDAVPVQLVQSLAQDPERADPPQGRPSTLRHRLQLRQGIVSRT